MVFFSAGTSEGPLTAKSVQGSVHVHIAKLEAGAPASHVSAASAANVSLNEDLHARFSVTAPAGGLVCASPTEYSFNRTNVGVLWFCSA